MHMRLMAMVFGLLFLIVSTGCLPLLVGGGAGVREITDKVEIYNATLAQAEKAVRAAIKDLGGRIKEFVRDESGEADDGFTVRARTFDGEHLTIDVEPTSPKSVEIDIRVGRVGSKQRAKEIHQALQKYISTKGV